MVKLCEQLATPSGELRMRAEARQPRLITSHAISRWLESGTESLPLPCIADACDWAKEVWSRSDASATEFLEGDLDPDRLHALLTVAYDDPLGDPLRAEEWYQIVEVMDWPVDEFGERLALLSRLAYVISRQYRRAGEPRSSWVWEKKAVELARELPWVSDFLALEELQRTDQLRDRFLTDPCVLLALCAGLHSVGNRNPAEALRQAISTHSYVVDSKALGLQQEEQDWFLIQLEIVVALGHKFAGNFVECDRWLDAALARCDVIEGPDISHARIEFARRAIDYDRRAYATARAELPQLTERFRSFGMERYVALSAFLDGALLKEGGRHAEALVQLYSVASNESTEVEGWFRGLALIYAAEICAKEGESQSAFETLSKAWALVGESKSPTAVGHYYGVQGELLRDLGHLDAAVESYRQAVSTYEKSQCKVLETLLRIILAETLLACGCEGEALAEIVAALPIIESLGLVQEGVVAVALLRESLSRQSADRDALLTLRRALQGLNNGNRS